MRCPHCSNSSSQVIDSRLGTDGTIRRRRKCKECAKRFTTRERVERQTPQIVKRDERREDFSREKILTSVQKACEKRPVSSEDLELLVDRVERRVQEQSTGEVSSHVIGEFVLAEVVALDTLAAARFASVFEGFENADDYALFFASIERGRP
ncbi:MAG: transcriptional regulator NrdR [Myxococcota bacterium]